MGQTRKVIIEIEREFQMLNATITKVMLALCGAAIGEFRG